MDMSKLKQAIGAGLLIIGFIILLELAVTGRMAIFAAIALTPDSVTMKK